MPNPEPITAILNYPRITPCLAYKDPGSAINWLEKNFGFNNRLAIPGDDGGIVHGELAVEDSLVIIGPSQGYHENNVSPDEVGGKFTQSINVYVRDVDAHYEWAKQNGATIINAPEDMFYGVRKYEVLDCEGHLWVFSQKMKEITREGMLPAIVPADSGPSSTPE